MNNYRVPGGKGGAGVAQTIINQMPPHKIYIEGFLGNGFILRRKYPAEINIAFDRDIDAIDNLPDTDHEQIIELRNECFIDWLEKNIDVYNLGGHPVLFYLDPPYLRDSRKDPRPLYQYEMTDSDHERLLKLIRRLRGYVIISGYWSNLYEAYLGDWRFLTFQSQTRGGTATEYLWFNYPAPLKLHDYSKLGANAMSRQALKRKIDRWVERIKRHPRLEAMALLDAIGQIKESELRKD